MLRTAEIPVIEFRRPKIVVTLHGIQTTGKWQKEITPYLAKHGLIPYHLDYGWFDVLRFLLPWTRNRRVRAIREELRELVRITGADRISVIAHSFGTFQVMEALQREHGELKYDRVVLTGSIVPIDYDWENAFDNEQSVMAVRNERADEDWVAWLAGWVSQKLGWLTRLKAGNSGGAQFVYTSPRLIDTANSGDHSSTLNASKFERWARFIAYPNLPDDILRKVQLEIQAFRQESVRLLSGNVENIRICLFAPIDGALRMVPGASENMTYAPEYDLCIEADHGATGGAFRTGNTSLIQKVSGYWGGDSLPGDELAKIHPDLSWVVAIPIKNGETGAIVGVLSLDGLGDVPAMLKDDTSQECEVALFALTAGINDRIAPALEAAFRGDSLRKLEV